MNVATHVLPTELRAIREWLTSRRRAPTELRQHEATIETLARRLGVDAWMDGDDSLPKSEPGTCFVCGCTEMDACHPPCGWADRERTICTTCDNAAKEGE